MKSSKWMIGLVAVVLMLTVAPSSFAQIQIQLNNTASTQEVATSRMANTSDILSSGAGLQVSGQLFATSTLTTTTLTLTFPATITSGAVALDGTFGGTTALVPSATEGIRIEGATGVFANVTAVASVNYMGKTITVTLPGCGAGGSALCTPGTGNTQSGSFRIMGVRLNANELGTGASAITNAQLGSSAAGYFAPPTPYPSLIGATGSGIASIAISSGNTAQLFSNQTNLAGNLFTDGTAAITVTEGFPSAWRTALQGSTSGGALPNAYALRFTIANLPVGVTVAFAKTAGTPVVAALAPISGTTAPATASGTVTQTFEFTTTNLSVSETLTFSLTLGGTATTPATPANITLTATMFPSEASTVNVLLAGVPAVPSATVFYPRFTTSETPGTPVVIGTILRAQTTLLVPYVAFSPPKYDMGFAISNTTKDPLTAAQTATPTDGKLTLTMYPRAMTSGIASSGTTITVSTTDASFFTAGIPNMTGINASGLVPAGVVFTGYVSQLLARASPAITDGFQGYMVVQADFLNAHAAFYLVEGGVITANVPALVIDPADGSRNTSTAESLGF